MKYISLILIAIFITSCSDSVKVKETSYNIYEVSYDTDSITPKDYLRSYLHVSLQKSGMSYEDKDSLIINFINKCTVGNGRLTPPSPSNTREWNEMRRRILKTPYFEIGDNDLHLLNSDSTDIKSVEITHYGDKKLLVRITSQIPAIKPIDSYIYQIPMKKMKELSIIGTFRSALFGMYYHLRSIKNMSTGNHITSEEDIFDLARYDMYSSRLRMDYLSDCKKLSKHTVIMDEDEFLSPYFTNTSFYVDEHQIQIILKDEFENPYLIGTCPVKSNGEPNFKFVIFEYQKL